MASGRVYASYGAVYIGAVLAWLWLVDGIQPDWRDVVGVGLALCGAGVIASGTDMLECYTATDREKGSRDK